MKIYTHTGFRVLLLALLVIAAGLLAVVYGAAQSAALLRASPGNERMQEIAAAIQEGAQAYLRRQSGLDQESIRRAVITLGCR